MRSPSFPRVPTLRLLRFTCALILFSNVLCFGHATLRAAQQEQTKQPAVSKVEPPNWWIGLAPEVMVLLSGNGLDATRVSCNLSTVKVTKTQSSAGGDYLFVWLKIGTETKSGTLVCRATTPAGVATFELPLSERRPALRRYQGVIPDDVIYLIMPDRFANGDPTNDEPEEAPGSHDRSKPRAYHGGDLRGITQHLPYLKDLGVTTLWLTPVVKNGATQDYHGYGAVDLYAVEPHLGTLRDYQDLVTAAHQLKMKILFDAVPNHTGPNHPWVAKPPLPDWFHGTKEKHDNSSAPIDPFFYAQTKDPAIPHDPFEVLADPHATPRMKHNLTDGWFFGVLPDLNTENPLVEQYLLQNGIWWAETSGLDGYRVDTLPYVSRKFWSNWSAGLKKLYPSLTTIGEVFHPGPQVTSFFVGGRKQWDGLDTGLSTVFDYPLYFVLRDILLRGGPVGGIANILRQDALYSNPGSLVTFFGNHDVPRFAEEVKGSPAKIKLAFGLSLTLRGIPQLYYGDEIGMPGAGDPDNRRDFPGGWPHEHNDGFTRSGRTAEQQEIFEYVQRLLKLRQDHEALRRGRLSYLASDQTAFVFLRQTEDETLVVAFNNSEKPRELTLPLAGTPASAAAEIRLILGSATGELLRKELHVSAPPQSLSIFQLNSA